MADGDSRLTQADGVSLRDYIDAQIKSQEQARVVALAAMEKRLEGMNEFRQSMNDMAQRTVNKGEYESLREQVRGCANKSECQALMGRTEADIRTLLESKALLEGKASQKSVTAALVFSVAGVIFGLVGILEKFVK